MPTQSKKKQAQRRRVLWVILFLAAASLIGWWLWRDRMRDAPRFHSMTVQINQDTRKVLPGETLSLHPNDRLQIQAISTNIPLNLNVRLSADNFDVSALQYEPLKLSDLIPGEDPFDRYRFVIHVKHYNQDMGNVIWVVQPYAEDWLDKADRIIDTDRRIDLLTRGLRVLPENRPINRRLIDEYKAVKNWKKAAAMLERAAAKKPEYQTLSELLSVYQEMNDTTGVLRIIEKIIEMNPNDVEARKAYAELLEASEDWNRAIRAYESLSAQLSEGEQLEACKRLGYLYTQTRNYEKAIDAYLRAAKLDQKDANLHYNLSYLYEKTGQKEKADFYLDNAVTLKSSDLEGRVKLARRMMERGEYQKARGYLSEVLERKPKAMTALVMMARVLEKEGDKKALKSIYAKMLSLDPDDDTLRYNLGALEYETGNLKAALPYFKAYSAAHPEDADVHGILFDIYIKQKEFSSAFKEATAIAERKPHDTGIYDFIFKYLVQKGAYKDLIPLLQRAMKANPEDIPIRKYLISTYLKTEKTDPAILQMETLLRQKPKDVDSLLQDLFDQLQAAKAYGKILGIMKKAVKAYPHNADLRGYLIFAYLETGKQGPAMEQMEELLKLRPDDLDLWLQLARLREKLDDIAGASRAYKRVLELSPEHPEASEAYLRLRLKGVSDAEGE